MSMLTRDALLGASDLVERTVPLPSIGGSVRVRSLPAAYSNEAMSEALEVITGPRGQQTARVNTRKLEALQVLHGLVEPKLNSIEDAYTFASKCGPAWRTVVNTIDEISGIDKEAMEKTQTAFPAGGSGDSGEVVGNGTSVGGGGSDLHVHSGSGVGDAGGGAG